MSRLYLIDALPVRRRHLFAMITLPSAVALLLGYGAGRIGISLADSEKPMIAYDRTEWPRLFPPTRAAYPILRVPGGFCQIAWDGRPPEITAPWGEFHAALSFPLFQGSRAVVYSPFHTPKGCSEDFAAWQIGRAIEAVYGNSLPFEEIKERYLAEGSIDLRREHGDWLPRRQPSLVSFLLLPTGLLWMVLLILQLRAYRATITDRARKILFFGLLALTLALHLGVIAMYITRFVRPWVAASFLKIILGQAGDLLPASSLLIWGVSALAIWGAYRIARSQFQQVEAPVQGGRQ